MPENLLPPLPPEDDETRTVERVLPADTPPSPPPRRRRPRREEDDGPPRRLWSAGHALIVCVLALAIGLLLERAGDPQVGVQQA